MPAFSEPQHHNGQKHQQDDALVPAESAHTFKFRFVDVVAEMSTYVVQLDAKRENEIKPDDGKHYDNYGQAITEPVNKGVSGGSELVEEGER